EEGSNENAAAPAPNLRVFDESQQRAIDELERQIEGLRRAREQFDPAPASAFADWQRAASETLQRRWRPCTVTAARARSAQLAPQPDGSVLASGALADRDVYDLECTAAAGELSALRLEALRQGSHGPGRADKGNAVLTGIEVTAATGDGCSLVPVQLSDATADFAQRGFPPAAALGGDAQRGWAFAGSAVDHAFVCRCTAGLSAAGLPAG